jgi:DNA-binding transcriptional LysR family regulator
LAVFTEAARGSSFAEAAGRLKISTAAVSRAILRLERQLDCRLFNRSTRHLSLTEDGKFFLDEISGGLEALAVANERMRERRNIVSGTLKVFMPNAFAKNHVMPQLAPFLDRYPALRLDLHVVDLPPDLLCNGFDAAVQVGSPQSSSYICRNLGAFRVALVASPAYLGAHGTPRTPADLADHACVNTISSGGGALRWRLSRVGAPAPDIVEHVPTGRCFVQSQVDTVVQAAVYGVGIVPTDVVAARRYLDSGELKVVLPEYEVLLPDSLFAVYPHREHLPLKVRAFLDLVAAAASQSLQAEWFDPWRYAT